MLICLTLFVIHRFANKKRSCKQQHAVYQINSGNFSLRVKIVDLLRYGGLDGKYAYLIEDGSLPISTILALPEFRRYSRAFLVDVVTQHSDILVIENDVVSVRFGSHIQNAQFQIDSQNKKFVQVSKRLSNLLRHGMSGKYTYLIKGNAYVPIDVVLALPEFKNVTRSLIDDIVVSCPKQRFTISCDSIRANQGHTIKIDPSLVMETLDENSGVYFCTHGTTTTNLPSILDVGLSRCLRQHIHAVQGRVSFGHPSFPGYRGSSNVLILIDVIKAMRDGIPFYRSSNGVILTPGDAKGLLSPRYFADVQTKAEQQIFGLYGDLRKAVSNISDVSAHAIPVVEGVKDIVDRTNVAAQSITETVNSALSARTEIFSGDLFGNLIKVVKILVNCAMAKDGMKVWNFLFNVSMEFGSDITNELKKLLLPQEAKLQINLEGVANVATYLQDAVGNNAKLTVVTLGAAIAVILQVVLGLPKMTTPDQTLKFFGDRCRNMKNIVDFGNSAGPMFGAIGEYLVDCVHPNLRKHSLDEFLEGYDTWHRNVMELAKVDANLQDRLQKDKALVFHVDSLYKKGVEYASLMKLIRVKLDIAEHYYKTFKIIEAIRKTCDYTGVFGNRPRAKPLVVYLFGESGVGKSGMTWPLTSDLNCAFSDSIDEAKNYAAEVYFRNTEQEFWDGYAGQNVVVYDDFGQRVDGSASPNEEYMEIIRTANMAPYPLHMASIDEKKRTKFVSKAIVLTSNILNQHISSLTFPDAVFRRVDICGKVEVADGYSKPGWSSQLAQIVNRLDRTKCDGPCDTNCYEITLYDPESKTPILNKDGTEKKVNYDEFLDMCLSTAKRSYEDSMMFNEKMDVRIDQSRFNALRAKLQGPVSYTKGEETVHMVIEPLDANVKRTFKQSLQDLVNIKNVLILVGVILAGFGIWKYFFGKSNPTNTETHHGNLLKTIPVLEAKVSNDCMTRKVGTLITEASSSGDNVTCKPRSLITEASVSNDHKTIKPGRLFTEAFSSSDNMTKASRRIVSEASVSGDNVTRKPATLVSEACVSGDPRTKQLAKVITEADAELQAWKDKTAQDLISHRILSNLYKIRSDGRDLLNGLFVRDTIMLVPRHLLGFLGDEVTIWNGMGASFTVPTKDLKTELIVDSAGNEKDAMLIKFPRLVNAHTDLVKHFQKMPELSLRRADICLPTIRKVGDSNIIAVLGNTKANFQSVSLRIEDKIVNIRDAIQYCLNTAFGDCGAPVIVNETSVLRKIAGIHIAATIDGASAFGQSVTQNDLERHIQRFNPIITDHDDLPNFEIKESKLQMNVEYTPEDLVRILNMPATTFSYIGSCSRVPMTPGKTDIRPSVIHGYVEPITKPAFLYHPTVDMVHKNMEKCAINTPYIPEDEVDRAVQEVKIKLLSGDSRNYLNKVLSFEEAVAGNDQSEFISGINRSSSPGYPWSFLKEAGKPGKQTWFGSTDYVFDETVKTCVMERIELARQGVRVPTVWTDTLKDERRPIEKVNALKTRVFAHGPMDYTIAFRMYFLGFIAHIMENRIENEQSVGTNPFGNDWKRTAKKLQTKGTKVFAGDFSTFDGTLNSCIMSKFASVANEFYNDGPENARVRETLMLEIFNSTHLCNDKYIQLTHSQPSGNPLTTVLNSFYNSVSMRIAFYRCVSGVNFNDHVSMVSYGDDNVINFTDDVAELFNQNTVTDAYATIGMIYTDESKSGGEVANWRKLSEVAYLKRGFIKDGAEYRCPMAMETIMETPNWIRKAPDSELACKENVESSVMELAQYSREVFEKQSQLMIGAYYDKTGEYPDVKTFETYRQQWSLDYLS